MSRVFIVQDSSRQSFTPAEKFGEIQTPFFPEHIQVYRVSEEAVDRVYDQLTAVKFSDQDFLILNGDPVLIFIMGCAIADYTDSSVNLLKWDRREHVYVAIQIPEVCHRESGNIIPGNRDGGDIAPG